MAIARDRRSLEAGFKWRALAGDAALPAVVANEVHRRGNPEVLSKDGLRRILALDDRLPIGRLAGLDRGALEPLLASRPLEDGAWQPVLNFMVTQQARDNLRRYLDGRPLRNVLDIERLY